MILRGVKIGIFGAGHLGRAVASRLVLGGIGADDLTVCHGGSSTTLRELEKAGLAHLIKVPAEVVNRSKILLYLVRPQDYMAIAEYRLPRDVLFVSFLAGVPLERIPVQVPESQRVRVMTSAPDTLIHGKAIAAVYPATDREVRAMLGLIGARIFPLRQQSGIHAFTALGPCLPIALTLWEDLGLGVEERQILDVAERSGLPDYVAILKWAREVQPRGLTGKELDLFINQATTPGGVTEAILLAMRQGKSLSDSLCCGIQRSIELSQGASQ